MKKLFAFLAVFGMLSMGASSIYAQEEEQSVAEETTSEQVTAPEEVDEAATGTEGEEPKGIHKQIKAKFIVGGAMFMSFVLLALIFGLAMSIEWIIYLNLSSTNTKKLLQHVEDALNEGGVEAAKEVCRNTRGPVASIFYQGLDLFE
jgi:biopolymer transport protein ExbB